MTTIIHDIVFTTKSFTLMQSTPMNTNNVSSNPVNILAFTNLISSVINSPRLFLFELNTNNLFVMYANIILIAVAIMLDVTVLNPITFVKMKYVIILQN